MGNLQKWGGPLPIPWIDKQAALQVQLLARMRELGMRPVLSAFAVLTSTFCIHPQIPLFPPGREGGVGG